MPQCDQIGRFFYSSRQLIFLEKKSKYLVTFGAFLNYTTLQIKAALATFWATCVKIGLNCTPTSGHTGCWCVVVLGSVRVVKVSVNLYPHYIFVGSIQTSHCQSKLFQLLLAIRRSFHFTRIMKWLWILYYLRLQILIIYEKLQWDSNSYPQNRK